jgi:hypothetical protein
MRKQIRNKPNFDEAVAFLRATYGSHNKAALAVGLSKSGYKYLVKQNEQRPRSGHTKDWVCQRAVELGWHGGDAA